MAKYLVRLNDMFTSDYVMQLSCEPKIRRDFVYRDGTEAWYVDGRRYLLYEGESLSLLRFDHLEDYPDFIASWFEDRELPPF